MMNCTTNGNEKLPIDPQSLYAALNTVEDGRCKRGKRYPVGVILAVIVLAKLCGETELRGIAQWAQYRASELCQRFGLHREGMPHASTYSRVLGGLNMDDVQETIRPVLAASDIHDTHLNIDGKTLRGTIAQGQRQGEHLLALYAPNSRRVIAQLPVDKKENEISVAPQVLAQAELKAKVVTGDAMFTQRTLSEQIVEAGGDYVWVVKDNQPDLRQAIECLFRPQRHRAGHGTIPTDFRCSSCFNKGHGRLERRSLTASSLLRGYGDWPYLQQVFRLERSRQLAGKSATTEVVYGMTSLSALQASPSDLLGFLRLHWSIENQLHYVRDVSLLEDRCHLKSARAQHLMAVLNNLVVSLLPLTPFHYLPDAQRFFNAHLSLALHLLF